MIPTPRERCLAALAAIDRLGDKGIVAGRSPRPDPRLDGAYRELAMAMDAYFGPLPAESEIARVAQLRAERNLDDL